MLRTHVYLNFETLQALYAVPSSRNESQNALTMLRGLYTEVLLFSNQPWHVAQDWLAQYHLSYLCLYKDEHISWLDRLFRRIPTDAAWKNDVVKLSIVSMDSQKANGDRFFTERILFIDQDEQVRSAIVALQDPRLVPLATLAEIAKLPDVQEQMKQEMAIFSEKLREYKKELLEKTPQQPKDEP